MSFRVIQMPPQTLTSWWDEKDELDFEPSYQRKGNIWSPAQKQGLIDSIINGFDIPKLYLADFTLLNSHLNENNKKYAVIDGKQRLLTVISFFENEFSLAKNFIYFDDPTVRLGGLTYKDLVVNYPRISRRFDNFSLTVMSVVTDDEAKISELFVRLNTSKPLTGAEIRNALIGEVPNVIRELVTHEFWTKTRFSKLRGQDKNTAAKLLLIEHRGTFVDTKKRQLDQMVAEAGMSETRETTAASVHDTLLEDQPPDESVDDQPVTHEDVAEAVIEAEEPDIRHAAGRVRHVLDRLAPLFIENDPLLNQQAQIPVIYWLVRGLEEAQLRHVRPFLVHFDQARARNKSLPADHSERDPFLSDFELMSRTSNDQGSIGGRYRTMQERFNNFIHKFAVN